MPRDVHPLVFAAASGDSLLHRRSRSARIEGGKVRKELMTDNRDPQPREIGHLLSEK